MEVRVCDVIMGAGKTEGAITQMNEDTDSRYIFITPYLDEADRIVQKCPARDFYAPQNKGFGKLSDLHDLLREQRNIASTHALFRSYNEETISLIKEGGYKLILDEVFKVVEPIKVSGPDVEMLLGNKMIAPGEDERVRWLKSGYEGQFSLLRDMCETGHVVLYKNRLLLWTFPVEVFRAFRDVIILTYMFDAQVQKYYFDINGVAIRKIGTRCEDGVYRFCDDASMPEYVRSLPEKIHILDDEKLNRIGEPYFNLSAGWYLSAKHQKGAPKLRQLKNNIGNVFKNKFSSSGGENLWTTFKDYQGVLKGKGYTKGFLQFNMRATNQYVDRKYLAYCVNVFYNPMLKGYFRDHGVFVDEDEYALSEMIQWVWRSAIRRGEEIQIYIPSSRMRGLMVKWLDGLNEGTGKNEREDGAA